MLFPNIYKNNIWKEGYNKLCIIRTEGTIVDFTNIRNFDHNLGDSEYISESFNTQLLEKTTLYSIPFGFQKSLSHLILEFSFSDGKKIFLSVEARRQPGENFSIIKSFFKHYGLIYIWGTKNDLIGLRKDIRKADIFSYELKIPQEGMTKGFEYFIERTNKLRKKPEYYGLFTNNCVINFFRIFKKESDRNIKFSWEIIFAGHIERYLKKYGYID